MKDYYQILEIAPGSSVDEIKQAYRKLAKRYHPDINKSPDAHGKFIEISEAYEVLLRNVENKEPTVQYDHSEYEAFIRDIREAAQRQARMRYEKFAREHEAFRESGLYDFVLLMKYLGKALLPFIAAGLISIPVIVSMQEHSWQPVFYLFFFWVIGGALLFFILSNLKGYFRLGRFYYNYDRLSGFYKHTNEAATEECFYCPGVKADSIPYRIAMVKVKDIKLENRGPLQHYAGYGRKEFSVPMPRSRKAFILHSFSSVIKLLSILLALFLFPFDSLLWRFIAGIFTGWVINSVFLRISSTRSKSGYLFSYGMLVKIVVWMGVFSLVSHFDFRNFNITTSDYIMFCFFILLFFDALLEQVIKIPGQGALFRPIMPYYRKLDAYFDDHCQLYLEIPLWTSLNPFIRWIF